MEGKKRTKQILLIILFAVVLWQICDGTVAVAIKAGIKAVLPFVFAFFSAYLLYKPTALCEKLYCGKGKPRKWKRGVAVFTVLLLFFGLIGLFVAVLVPNIVTNIKDIIDKMPEYAKEISVFANEKLTWLGGDFDAQALIDKAAATIAGNSGQIINIATNVVSGSVSFLFDMIICFIASFYILYDFDGLKRGFKRLLGVICGSGESFKECKQFFHKCDIICGKYIVIKIITSLGIGIVGYIGFKIMGLPYTFLMGTALAVTNPIPYIGPFIGGALPVFIALLISPAKAIEVVIFMILLQQIEGNIITPKVTGDVLNVNPLWVLLGVAVGGAMFGILGMILGVPAAAIVVELIKIFIKKREQKKENKNAVE